MTKKTKITVAYISYRIDQDEPSKPMLAEIDTGNLELGLKKLFMECFDELDDYEADEVKNPTSDDLDLFKGQYWGDVIVGDKTQNDESFVFVTFADKDRGAALKGLSLRKSKFQT